MAAANTDKLKGSSLHMATRQGDLDTVKHLVDEDNINSKDKNGITPLHLAAESGNIKILNHLVDKGADVNIQEDNGQTPLHLAVSKGRDFTAKRLINKRAVISIKDMNGMTPLHLAAESGLFKIVKHFVEKGADINIQDDIGRTPIHVAAHNGRDYTVEYLVKEGADISIKDKAGMTPLHLAAESGRIKVIQILVAQRADINIQDDNGWTPLHVAASKGRDYTVKYLVKKGADISIKDKAGMTPLHLAAESGRIKVIQVLVAQRADINIQDDNRRTPLHVAASKGRDYTVEYLVKKRADISTKDKAGMTPLHLAAESGRIKVIQILVAQRADINSQDDNGLTPLHLAAREDHDYTVKCLVKRGADIRIENKNGRTPMEEATERGHMDTVQYLGGDSISDNESSNLERGQSAEKNTGYSGLFGVEVVGEVKLVVTNEAMNFQWKDHGFKLHVPENALPEGISEYSINIRVSLSGQFELPEGYELVSAVYWVKTQGTFTKPITVEVQHCANFSKSCHLCFVHTSCTQKSLPYKFEFIEGGSFVLGCKYGVLSTTHFSGTGVAKKVTPGEHSCQYCGQVYFTVKHPKECWYCHFVVTKDLETCFKVMMRKYQQEYDIAHSITFGDDHVALDIAEDGVQTESGWEIKPLHQARIKKNDVDNFSPEKIRVPECVLVLKWFQRDKAPDLLDYKVKLLDTGDDKDFFRIIHHPESAVRSLHASCPTSWTLLLALLMVLSIASAIAGLWWFAPTLNPNCHTIEDVSAILDELHPITDWKTLGEELRVSWEDLEAINGDNQKTEHKMRETIHRWFRSKERPCWEMVVSVLKKMNEKNLANKIAEKYGVNYTEV